MKKRYQELDMLRGIAILAVLLIHITSESFSNSLLNNFEENTALFINQVARFAVPAFIFLSGLGLTIANKSNQGYFKFLKNQISKIIILYVIWSFIYYLYNSEGFHLVGFIKGLVLGSNFYHLYFVPVIIFFYLLYPVLARMGKSTIGLTVILLVTLLSQLADFITGIEFLNNSRNVFNWIFYFVLGIWTANNFASKIGKIKEKKLVVNIILPIAIAALFIESYNFIDVIGLEASTTSMRPSIILFTIIFIMSVLSIDWKNGVIKKWLLKLSDLSYGMYLSHALFLAIFVSVSDDLGLVIGSIAYIVIAFLIITPFSILATILFDKIVSSVSSIRLRKKN